MAPFNELRLDSENSQDTRFDQVQQWKSFLAAETVRAEETGTAAAIWTIRPGELDERQSRQLDKLIWLSLASTDRLHQTPRGDLCALLMPVGDMMSLQHRAVRLWKAATGHRLDVQIGYARRRPNEALLDTWARSDAELDRAEFRIRRLNVNLDTE